MELELSKSINQRTNFLRENGKIDPWKISEWKRYFINILDKFSILRAWKEGLGNEKLDIWCIFPLIIKKMGPQK